MADARAAAYAKRVAGLFAQSAAFADGNAVGGLA